MRGSPQGRCPEVGSDRGRTPGPPRRLPLEDRTTPSTLIAVSRGPRPRLRRGPQPALRHHLHRQRRPLRRRRPARCCRRSPSARRSTGPTSRPTGSTSTSPRTSAGPTQGFFHKIDLTDPALTSHPGAVHHRLRRGRGVGHRHRPGRLALATTRYEGSGWVGSAAARHATDTFTMPAAASARTRTCTARPTARSCSSPSRTAPAARCRPTGSAAAIRPEQGYALPVLRLRSARPSTATAR